MTEKVSLWQAIKDNWGQLTLIGGVLLIVGGIVMEWRIQSNVEEAMTFEAMSKYIKIIEMDKEIALNTGGVSENKEDIGGLDERTLMAFQALFAQGNSNNSNAGGN